MYTRKDAECYENFFRFTKRGAALAVPSLLLIIAWAITWNAAHCRLPMFIFWGAMFLLALPGAYGVYLATKALWLMPDAEMQRCFSYWEMTFRRRPTEIPVTAEERAAYREEARGILDEAIRNWIEADNCQIKARHKFLEFRIKHECGRASEAEFAEAHREHLAADANLRLAAGTCSNKWEYLTQEYPYGIGILIGPAFSDLATYRTKIAASGQ